MSDPIQNNQIPATSSPLLLPFHLLHHGFALASVLIRKPIVILRNAIMGFFYIKSLGYGHTSCKVSSRLKSWLKIPPRHGCFVCDWINEANLEFGPEESTRWLNHYRPSQAMLDRFRERAWPETSPVFTLLLQVDPSSQEELQHTIRSITRQTYSRWELIMIERNQKNGRVDGMQADPRIRTVKKDEFHLSIVRGTHVALVGQGDRLEPQALHRMAEGVLETDPDMLYSDEAMIAGDGETINRLIFRTAFSEDGFLSHPEIYQLFVIRKKLLEQFGSSKDWLTRNPSPALVFKGIAAGKTIVHIPEILYLRRNFETTIDTGEIEVLLRQHLAQRGQKARIFASAPGFWNVAYEPSPGARVAIIIPTKNQGQLLKTCLDSLTRTVPKSLADVYVINHQSDEPETLELLEQLRSQGKVIEWNGIFNFSEMNNHAVSQLRKKYSHYLFLNNDTEAIEEGWLEHMLGLGSRGDVGIVGAVLIYPDGRAQHAGVAIGIYGGAGHLNRLVPMLGSDKKKIYEGRSGEVAKTRDVSAVTGACLLIGSQQFEAIGRFDPALEVGFGDIDLCHKVRQLGYRVLIDGDAVLYHYESLSRGMKMNPHPGDTRKYLARYADLILQGDPYFHRAYRRDNTTPVPLMGKVSPEKLSATGVIRLGQYSGKPDHIFEVA